MTNKSNYIKKLILGVFGLVFTGAFIISFVGFKKTLFNLDPIINGVALSKIASDIRIDLIKNKKALEITFNSKDGLKLSGLAFLRNRPLANMIICHGYRGCKETLYRFIDYFPDFNILLFDFRAHGQSFGDFTSIGYFESNDVLSAIDFFKSLTQEQASLTSESNKLPMILLGVSMGGAAILKAIDKEPKSADAVILDSSYADLYTEIVHAIKLKAGLPQIPFLWIMQRIGNLYAGVDITNVKPCEYIKNLDIPVFIIHSVEDAITPTFDALTLYSNAIKADRKARIWLAPPSRHPKLHIDFPEIYTKKVMSFLKKFKVF